MTEKKVFTVKQVEDYLERMLGNEPLFKRICIRGEVSGCNPSNKGHLYFNLKDATGIIPSVIFKGWLDSACSFKMEDGQDIVAEGKLEYYRDRGTISFKVTKVELYGEGMLNLLFEQLKKRLTEEGLFDSAKKKPISKHPKRVGIVTSKSGDAVDDIEKTAKKRNPYVELILYPVTVQGKDSAMEFARGIKTLDKMGVDTIIIGRGGGSKEDLDAFNDERLIRAVYEAETPVISATGHSKNWTLADYVADLRVITPTEAAIEAIPDLMKELRRIDDYKETMDRQIRYRLQMAKSRINELEGKLRISGPEETLKRQMLTLRQLNERIHPAIQRKYSRTVEHEVNLRALLHPAMQRKLVHTAERQTRMEERLYPVIQRKLTRAAERQAQMEERLYPALHRKLDRTVERQNQMEAQLYPVMQRKLTRAEERQAQVEERLYPAMQRKLTRTAELQAQMEGRLYPAMQRKLTVAEERQGWMEERLYPAMHRKLDVTKRNAVALLNQLHALAPTAKLQGGFGYIEVEREKSNNENHGQYSPLKSIEDAGLGDHIRVTLHDGRLSATVDDVATKSRSAEDEPAESE